MSKKSILIVEDETQLRSLYTDLLEAENFQVTSASTGVQALEYMEKKKYHLVLLDIRMPEMDGLAVSKEVAKNSKKYHDPHIVFLTNLSQNEVISDALHTHVAGYLIKGKLTPEELIHEVQSYLS